MVQKKKQRKAPRRLLWWKFLLAALLLVVIVLTGYFLYLFKEVESRFASRKWSIPSRVFSATVPLYPGENFSLSQVQGMLETRRYQQSMREPLRAGEYRVVKDSLIVQLREFRFPGRVMPSRRVQLFFKQNRLEKIDGREGSIVFLEMEPVEIARLFGPQRESRLLISIQQAPPSLIDAILSIEDHRFYEHPGVDWWGISRALWTDLIARKVVQGGSTITQQLVKNYFLAPERSLKRKVLEASMALIIEAMYDKNEILEMYMNEIYLGQRGSIAVHGVGEAARYYFGRNVEDLSLAEAATLAGMIRAPNSYSPYKHPEDARNRRNVVLKRMFDLKKIPAQDYERARGEPVRVAEAVLPVKVAPYFVDYVRHQLQELYAPEVLESEGLSIYTTLHPEMALAAETAVREGLEELEKGHPHLKADSEGSKGVLQAALVAVQPKTGAVLTLVGGRDYARSSFNRALYAHRQPGSAIKPFVFLSALDQFTPITWLPDQEITYSVGGRSWSPRNYDNKYLGRVTLRKALEQSRNCATVSLALAVGLDRVIETIQRVGIESPLQPVPSLALGAFEVTPLELASAYAALDNDGQKPYLLSLKEVVSEAGEMQQRRHVDFTSVTTPAKAYLITSLLEGVIKRGTGQSLKSLGISFPCAGKTGTTSDYRDSWFVGYTTDLVVLVWVGFDDNRPTRLSGSQGAAKLWARFMKSVTPWIHPQPFRIPPGVVQRFICNESEQAATRSCPAEHLEYFLAERVPQGFCTLHE